MQDRMREAQQLVVALGLTLFALASAIVISLMEFKSRPSKNVLVACLIVLTLFGTGFTYAQFRVSESDHASGGNDPSATSTPPTNSTPPTSSAPATTESSATTKPTAPSTSVNSL